MSLDLETLRSLAADPAELKSQIALMGEKIKALTLKVEDLQGPLAGHREARFGPKYESLDQLAFHHHEDAGVAQAPAAHQEETDQPAAGRSSTSRANAGTVPPRYSTTSSGRPRFCLPGKTCGDRGGPLRALEEALGERSSAPVAAVRRGASGDRRSVGHEARDRRPALPDPRPGRTEDRGGRNSHARAP